MTAAIWAIAYDILDANRASYLAWFHHDHIAEKLARQGYEWAAHFEGAAHQGTADARGYLALFGGRSTAVFLNPSPAQLKLTQDDITRDMIALRRPAMMSILTKEWIAPDDPATPDHDDNIEFLALDSANEDMAVGAWSVQDLMPTVTASTGRMAKLISVTGAPHHVALCQPATPQIAEIDDAISRLRATAKTVTIAAHWTGRRIWPA